MKFTLSWLKEHLDTEAGVDKIAETLTKIGLEVEEVVNPFENMDGFVTARIEEVTEHPDSDHLHVLKVNDGTETFQIVCGAPNVKQGMMGILAHVGAYIPLFGEKIKVGKVRGVESFGMMCAEDEIGVGSDHSGIIELPANAPLGLSLAQVYKADPVFDISITPNRAECLGVRGVARDLAAAGLGHLKPLKIEKSKGAFVSPIKVRVEDTAACPVYTGRYIRGVNNHAETPKWMKDRLSAIGLRSISPLVDITNYINYDMARPLHVFDADKLSGNICVRMAKEGESFTSLEDKTYSLDTQALGVCDDEGVQCLGGIMGGSAKGCSEDTVNVFLESALFNPVCIARTGRKFQIDSDSRYRYERWVDPNSNVLGSDYATQLILSICGGEASEIEICGEENYAPVKTFIRPSRLKSFIGLEVSAAQIIDILTRLGFETKEEGDRIWATAPTWRGDIEGEHDLIEEVVRMIGLDNIPAESMQRAYFPTQTLLPAQRRTVTVKHELASRGLLETVTWSFTDSKLAKDFRKGAEPVLLCNPITAELDEMRPSVLINLLLGLKNNIARGYSNVSLFEVGPEFFGRKPLEQRLVAGGIRAGQTGKKHWLNEVRSFDVFDVKADALAAIAAANGPFDSARISVDAPSYYHPGRSGSLRLGNNVIAYFGELHPLVLKKFGLKQRVCAFEVVLDNIPLPRKAQDKSKKKLELSPLQPLDKDMAFIVDKTVRAEDLIAAARNADKRFIADVRVFDVYEGDNLPEDKKSIALALTFQPEDTTFSDTDIETLMAKVEMAAKTKCNAVLRDKAL
jgi:phenylalanyl-tRNA synthetase beta chain